MIRALSLILLVLSLTPSSIFAAEASQARYTLSAPEGWVVDTESGKAHGLHVVMYPKGQSWTNGRVVMYGNAASKDLPGNTNAEQVMSADIEAFKKRSPELKVGELKTLSVQQGKKVLLREFEGSIGGAYEAVAYIDEPKSVVILALSARTKEDFSAARSSFNEMLGSYKLIDSNSRDIYSSIEEAVNKLSVQKANKDASSPAGKNYQKLIRNSLAAQHKINVLHCVELSNPGEQSALPASLDFIVKVDKSGKTSQMYILKNNAIAACLKAKLEKADWPKPPFEPFHARLSISLK